MQEPTGPPDWAAVFGDPTAPLTVDVGCGKEKDLSPLSSDPGKYCFRALPHVYPVRSRAPTTLISETLRFVVVEASGCFLPAPPAFFSKFGVILVEWSEVILVEWSDFQSPRRSSDPCQELHFRVKPKLTTCVSLFTEISRDQLLASGSNDKASLFS